MDAFDFHRVCKIGFIIRWLKNQIQRLSSFSMFENKLLCYYKFSESTKKKEMQNTCAFYSLLNSFFVLGAVALNPTNHSYVSHIFHSLHVQADVYVVEHEHIKFIFDKRKIDF